MWNRTKGQALIEILVAMGVAALMLPAILTGFVASREGKVQQNQRLKAVGLAREAAEAVRSVRQRDWDNIAVNGIYHPEVLGTSWVLVAGGEVIEDFTRQLTISDYLRDGQVDPSIKRVEIEVSWNSILSSNVTLTIYLTRLDNLIYTETTVSDFDAGTKNGVVATNISGGEVQLSAGGRADWCEPELTIDPLELPRQGEAMAVWAIEGGAFAGTGANASGVSFANIEITNDYPPDAKILGTVDGYKTNDVFGEATHGYLATDTNNQEVVIINLSNYQAVGSFDTPGPADAESVFVLGNVGYVVSNDTLYTFDLSGKDGPRQALDTNGVVLAGKGKGLYVVGTNVYVATESSTQLQIVDAADPSDLKITGFAQSAGGSGVDVVVNESQTRAYLVTVGSAGQDELFVIDISDKSGLRSVVSSYNTDGMDPKGVTVVPGNRVIVVGQNGEEYQVVDITDEAQLEKCGGISIDSGVNDISSVVEGDGDAYSYIVTKDADSEFKIIEGGPGGQAGTSGSFESAAFAPGASAAFNRFVATVLEPNQTNITFQVGTADSVGGNCLGVAFSFVGPDGTADTFFETGGPIPYDNDDVGYENPGECFAYKAYFNSTDPASSPILYDVTVNYSP